MLTDLVMPGGMNGVELAREAVALRPGLPVILTYNGNTTAPSTAGTYAVAASINDANYTGSATGALVITGSTSTVTLGSASNRMSTAGG